MNTKTNWISGDLPATQLHAPSTRLDTPSEQEEGGEDLILSLGCNCHLTITLKKNLNNEWKPLTSEGL
jgi:hypothetical protein